MILINGAFLIWNIIKKRRNKKHDQGLAKLKEFLKKQKKLTKKKGSKIEPVLDSAVKKKEKATTEDHAQNLSGRKQANQR